VHGAFIKSLESQAFIGDATQVGSG